MDYTVIERSGLNVAGELEAIFGVTRAMLYKYRKGVTPGKHTSPRIARAVEVLSKLIEKERLPLPDKVDAEVRARAVQKIIALVENKNT